MSRFTTTVRTDDLLQVQPDKVWQTMSDPVLLARLAPAVAEISTDGDRWCWRLVGISALGVSVAPSFTERMVFDAQAMRIQFRHDPPDGKSEAAGATGTYQVIAADAGAYVGIELTAHVDLPLPKLAAPAVKRIMKQTIVTGGQRFAAKLMDHLGVTGSRGMQVVDLDAEWPRVPAAATD